MTRLKNYTVGLATAATTVFSSPAKAQTPKAMVKFAQEMHVSAKKMTYRDMFIEEFKKIIDSLQHTEKKSVTDLPSSIVCLEKNVIPGREAKLNIKKAFEQLPNNVPPIDEQAASKTFWLQI